MENPKAETLSEPETESITTPHLVMGSSPESPTRTDSSSAGSDPSSPTTRFATESPVDLTVGSSPESPVKSNTFKDRHKPPSPPTGSPVHSSKSTSAENPFESNKTSSVAKRPSSPTSSRAESPVHLSVGSSSGNPSVSYTISSLPQPDRSAKGSPARSSISSDHTSLHHGSTPPREKSVGSSPAKPQPLGHVSHKPLELVPVPVVSWSVHEEPVVLTKMDPNGFGYGRVEEVGVGSGGRTGGGIGGSGRRTPPLSILKSAKRQKMMERGALGFRILGALLCLISFSVMAANRNMGWALDSFYRYKEFRYFMSVNVIGFVYSAAQAFDLALNLASRKDTGKNALQHPYRYYFDFAIDQMITYLLISASSSATARIDDWQANWGKDKFPFMASASVAMSYLAFLALALSSLFSGYALCTSTTLKL